MCKIIKLISLMAVFMKDNSEHRFENLDENNQHRKNTIHSLRNVFSYETLKQKKIV